MRIEEEAFLPSLDIIGKLESALSLACGTLGADDATMCDLRNLAKKHDAEGIIKSLEEYLPPSRTSKVLRSSARILRDGISYIISKKPVPSVSAMISLWKSVAVQISTIYAGSPPRHTRGRPPWCGLAKTG